VNAEGSTREVWIRALRGNANIECTSLSAGCTTKPVEGATPRSSAAASPPAGQRNQWTGTVPFTVACVVLSRSIGVAPEHERGRCTGVLSRDRRIASRNRRARVNRPRFFYNLRRDVEPCDGADNCG
jgi:hypothetical protein